MKHIPTIIDYSLLLDYAVSSGSAALVSPKKEESGIEEFCKADKDGYYWVKYKAKDDTQPNYYKTPFKKTRKLINVKEQQIKSLVEMWIRQYLTFSKKVPEYIVDTIYERLREKYGRQLGSLYIDVLKQKGTLSIAGTDDTIIIQVPQIKRPLGTDYGACLLLYTLLTVPARRVDTIRPVGTTTEYIPYTWSDINGTESVISVSETNTGNRVDPLTLPFFGTGAVYIFSDKTKTYRARIGTYSNDYRGSDYAGLVVGFIVDPTSINMLFIEQLVNNGFVYSVRFDGAGPDPNYWGLVKIKRTLSQSLSSSIIPYYFPVRRQYSGSLITSDQWLSDMEVYDKIIGTEATIGLVPNYFEFFAVSDMFDAIHKASPIYVSNIVYDQSGLDERNAFRQALISRLNQLVQDSKITVYDITGQKMQVKETTTGQKVMYLYNPIDVDLVLVMMQIFGIRNIVSEKDTYDCYQSFDVTRFPKQPYLEDIEKHWVDYADYSVTAP